MSRRPEILTSPLVLRAQRQRIPFAYYFYRLRDDNFIGEFCVEIGRAHV